MNHPSKVVLSAVATTVLCAVAPCQQTPDDSAVVEAKDKLLQHLRDQGVRVDLGANTIEIDAEVVRPMDPLEYVLIHHKGKDHEALFVTKVKASILHSAFLLLGYEPGENAKLEPIEPPPTEEEVAAGAEWNKVIPPEGMPLWLTIHWTEGEGEQAVARSACVEEMLFDMTTGEPATGLRWAYLGGRTAKMYRSDPPVFVGDYEGNLVSVCYLSPANHLATMVHERAHDDQNWWRTKVAPEEGTPVAVRFHKEKPAEVLAWEKRVAERKPEGGDDPGR